MRQPPIALLYWLLLFIAAIVLVVLFKEHVSVA